MSVEITQLITYPIKSCAGIKHQHVEVDAWGLAFDRQWMLVDQNQLFISQRKLPQMALIEPVIDGKQLILTAPGMPDCLVKNTTAATAEVTVWKDRLQANIVHEAVNHWFSQYLGTPCTLVQYGPTSQRAIDPDYSLAGDQVKFADGFPVLVTHQASLDAFNQQQVKPIPMDRFRPNIVVKTSSTAWSEHQWLSLSNDQMTLELPKPCSRCVMTGVNHFQGISEGSDVLRRLKNEFSFQDKAVFGMNGIPRMIETESVTLSIGMSLEVQNK